MGSCSFGLVRVQSMAGNDAPQGKSDRQLEWMCSMIVQGARVK